MIKTISSDICYIVEKKFTFAAAHALTCLEDDHPCSAFHGHNYELTIKISSRELDGKGFVIDFKEISKAVKPLIEDFDHSTILTYDQLKNTDVIILKHFKKILVLPEEYKNTSSEYLCKYFYDALSYLNNQNTRIIEISISETGKNKATLVYKEQLV